MDTQYHKIQTVFKRDANTRRIIEGDYTLPEFEYLRKNEWEFTEKVDGTNIRILISDLGVAIAGRTDEAMVPPFLLAELQSMFDGTANRKKQRDIFPCIVGTENSLGERVVLYGEGYGAKIQKVGSSYISDGVSFVLFDVKVGDFWLERESVNDVAANLGIRSVPVIGSGTLDDAVEEVRKGMKSQWGDFIAEGIVARPKVELFRRNGERVITKIKHRDFI